MRKLLIFGNSGSGKSTLAKKLAEQEGIAHLDLDVLAWQDTFPPQRNSLSDSLKKIQKFTRGKEGWVIEGCYSDLLELAAIEADEVIFLNLPIAACIENAKNRPWEPHKYPSKEEQDENLDMLIDWISDYDDREDLFSRKSHEAFYENFPGEKTMITENI
ncbi:MAG: AAA family ATPase [Pseudohongiellaceae bacterium]|nr:AAA family ATPase [Pseudohongiellaceae bacterium]